MTLKDFSLICVSLLRSKFFFSAPQYLNNQSKMKRNKLKAENT